jgi:transposase
MARTSTPWRLLPAGELGCGSPATCWRRLTEWANADVFEQLHLQVLDRLGEQGRLDWEQASVDTMSVRAKRGGTTWAQIQSIVASLEASSTWSATIRTPAGRRRTRPGKVHADKGYDSRANRAYLRRRGIKARIARREVESSTRLGRHRWKVERSLSWLSCFRRLQVRWDRDAGGGSRSCWWPGRWCASTGSNRSEGVTRRLRSAPRGGVWVALAGRGVGERLGARNSSGWSWLSRPQPRMTPVGGTHNVSGQLAGPPGQGSPAIRSHQRLES